MHRSVRLAVSCLVAFAALLAATGAPAKKGRGDSPVIPEDFLPIPAEHRALKSVPFAPGAPAVVLLAGEQTAWYPEFAVRREVRRIKILTEAGVHDYSDYQTSWWGEVRPGHVKARTILPDGTVVDAGDGVTLRREKDPDGLEIIVAFPRVEVGAILDLTWEVRADGMSVQEYVAQEDLPVLESRFLVAPAEGRRYRAALVNVDEKSVTKSEHGFSTGRMYGWTFHDLPPLPAVPNRPATSDIASKVVLINEGFYLYGRQVPYAADWKSLVRNHRDFYESWMKERDKKTKAFARSLGISAGSPRDKAEAVRQALRERFATIGLSDWPSAESADEVLDRGRGRSADAALLNVVMLRELGVDAFPAAIRLRSSGSLPPDVPVPSLLDDLLVGVPGGAADGGDLYYSPSVDQPVDVPSSDRVGVLAVPYRKGQDAPVPIPDLAAARNSIRRNLVLTPQLDGSLTGNVTVTLEGHHAERWRRALRNRDEEERKKWVEARLDDHVDSLRVQRMLVDGLERGGRELTLDVQIRADGALSKAGRRLLLNPFLFDRVDSADWPAGARELDIVLGRPSESFDSVLIQVPEGVSDVRLPQPLNLNAGAVGTYEIRYEGEGSRLRCSRRQALESTLFRAAAYDPLRAWFTDQANGDEQAIVFELAQ